MKGKNGTTAFLPLNMKKVEYVKDKEVKCLIGESSRTIYEKGRVKRHS